MSSLASAYNFSRLAWEFGSSLGADEQAASPSTAAAAAVIATQRHAARQVPDASEESAVRRRNTRVSIMVHKARATAALI
ncbi:hypothetical protein [Roseateles sp. L2-2]|uniref:hypothetical protein n=1 Tax=Roseateles sp. L2-2 TaxID=3422597 RepID=UPI003D35E849